MGGMSHTVPITPRGSYSTRRDLCDDDADHFPTSHKLRSPLGKRYLQPAPVRLNEYLCELAAIANEYALLRPILSSSGSQDSSPRAQAGRGLVPYRAYLWLHLRSLFWVPPKYLGGLFLSRPPIPSLPQRTRLQPTETARRENENAVPCSLHAHWLPVRLAGILCYMQMTRAIYYLSTQRALHAIRERTGDWASRPRLILASRPLSLRGLDCFFCGWGDRPSCGWCWPLAGRAEFSSPSHTENDRQTELPFTAFPSNSTAVGASIVRDLLFFLLLGNPTWPLGRGGRRGAIGFAWVNPAETARRELTYLRS
ncbi:hypothetical protein GGR51DRAFT_286921 [Nemania sp. FL0031]|nr:hypothetical protein GGR51DRAFT_286921 [Nemania sp. FL0031]